MDPQSLLFSRLAKRPTVVRKSKLFRIAIKNSKEVKVETSNELELSWLPQKLRKEQLFSKLKNDMPSEHIKTPAAVALVLF